MIFEILFKTLYFMLPVYFANMAPIFFSKLNFLNIPINTKLFGDHKTYRGFFFGILASIFIVYLQFRIGLFLLFDYSDWILIGFLFGFGALFGDLIESFFKRKRKIKPGNPWIPFDQIDLAIGSLLFIFPIFFDAIIFFIALIITPLLSFISSRIGFYLKIKKTKW